MANQQQDKQQAGREQQERQERDNSVGKYVLHNLGQPGDLQRLQVRHLWADHYRVNVFVGVDPVSVKVAHSYFLVVDSEGNILGSTPKITRHYEPVEA